MRRTTQKSVIIGFISLVTYLLVSPNIAQAQDWRFSAGYSLQKYGLEITPNSDYYGEIGVTQKGLLEVELERYILYRLYLSGTGSVLVNNAESAFHGGPINFNRTGLGLNVGVQWNKFGVYTGVHGSYTWNLKFKSYSEDDYDSNSYWIESNQRYDIFSGGFTFGAKYYLLNNFRIQAEVKTHSYSNQNFEPASDSGFIPAVSEVDFRDLSFTIGVSVSIPWYNREQLEDESRSRRPSTLMSVSGLQFDSPKNDALITSHFGPRWGRPHEGVDLDANRGDEILAAGDGVVEEISTTASYGRRIVLRHGREFTTLYAHLNSFKVKKGDRVQRGQEIGTAGSSGLVTGVHLHFEMRRNGEPVDPLNYIRF
ncbi:M23 family metallopeptidase [Rhodohalobacter sp.]|uniref:M23 family metallopeptidase n=1 Tax=Rhodohalobacter sp. TaxID=1974210 RepID=UPI002ACD95B7|nr:M23 family metallopeptidase [Rhodohalobacter sp.]MDZ7756938.1 M23 family metallopeptidase [Rhodohalobacter sp.]